MQMGMSAGTRWCCSAQRVPASQRPRSQLGQTARLVLSCLQMQGAVGLQGSS
jgi:hypothetical protein